MDRDCIFYSPTCPHSQKLLQTLDMIGLRNEFLLISVINSKFRMPAFVDRVPMLYDRRENAVFVDSALEEHLSKLSLNKNSTQGQDFGQSQQELLSGYSDLQSDGKFQDSFGFIDEDDHILNTSYGYVNEITQLPPTNPNSSGNRLESEHVGRSGKFDQRQYENYIQDRDAEIQNIYSNRKPM